MIVIEGTLALTGARFILRSLKEEDRMPGFRDGFTHVNRDESRHVGFGVKFLADAIKEDERYRASCRTTSRRRSRWRARVCPRLGRGPLRLRDPVRLPLVRDVRVRDALAVEEARRDGDVDGRDRRRRLDGATAEAGARRGPGRPATGAPERILEAAYEVLKRDGYAGMTTAKVAAASGQNKALISYYFGSKQGLVAAVARRVSGELTDEVLGEVGEPGRRASSWSRR